MENNDLVAYVRSVVEDYNAAFNIQTQKEVAEKWYVNKSPRMTFHDFVLICREYGLMSDDTLIMFAKSILD